MSRPRVMARPRQRPAGFDRSPMRLQSTRVLTTRQTQEATVARGTLCARHVRLIRMSCHRGATRCDKIVLVVCFWRRELTGEDGALGEDGDDAPPWEARARDDGDMYDKRGDAGRLGRVIGAAAPCSSICTTRTFKGEGDMLLLVFFSCASKTGSMRVIARSRVQSRRRVQIAPPYGYLCSTRVATRLPRVVVARRSARPRWGRTSATTSRQASHSLVAKRVNHVIWLTNCRRSLDLDLDLI